MDAKTAAREIAKLGEGSDRILAHINAEEAALLARLSGGHVNPKTGLPSFGWLQDWGSDFSMKHLNPFIEFRDPHKSLQQHLTKGMQSTVGPIALDFVPVVGGALSAGERVWLNKESKNPASSNYKAPSSSAGAEVAQGVATQAAVNGITGSGSSTASTGGASGIMGLLGRLFGGSKAAAAKPAATAPSAQITNLQQQVQQLKAQIDAHYADPNDPQRAQDHAQVDAWYADKAAQAQNTTQQNLQQEASQ